ncbi:MAG: peptidylprolyl isomerase [Coriobacteriia bacterium]
MKVLRIALALALVAGVAFGTVGCKDKDVAAKVNGDVIKKTELDAQVEKLKEQYPQMFTGADGEGRLIDFKQRLLDNMINALLIKQAAGDEGIEVTDADVDKKIQELKGGFQTDEQFEQALEQAGMDVAALEDQIREQLVTEQLIAALNKDTEVSDEEIKEYYDANKTQFSQQAATHASHILFDAKDKATAEKVLTDVKGGGDFAALAKEHSKDPASAAKGGDLGWPTTPYVAEFQSAADKLKPGQVSGLVETQFGWHIIKVIERRDSRQKTLEEVSDQVKQIIIQQRNADAYQEFLDKLRAEAEIEILIPELQKASDGSSETTGS